MPKNGHLVKAMVFPVVMDRCECWTIKKAESRRVDAFELWCWRRLLRVPWTARRSDHSIRKEINPEYSLEGLMLKLKLHTLATWCKELTHWKRPWCWERLKAEGKGDDRGYGWMASPTRWTWVWVSYRNWWTGKPGVLQSMGLQRVGHDWVIDLNWRPSHNSFFYLVHHVEPSREKKKKKIKRHPTKQNTIWRERASISIRGSRDAGRVKPEIQDNLTEAHTITNKSRKK